MFYRLGTCQVQSSSTLHTHRGKLRVPVSVVKGSHYHIFYFIQHFNDFLYSIHLEKKLEIYQRIKEI